MTFVCFGVHLSSEDAGQFTDIFFCLLATSLHLKACHDQNNLYMVYGSQRQRHRYIIGDFNRRIGDNDEYVVGVDELPTR